MKLGSLTAKVAAGEGWRGSVRNSRVPREYTQRLSVMDW